MPLQPWMRVFAPLFLLMLSAAGCANSDDESADPREDRADNVPTELESVTFALSWLPIQDAVGWFSALENGYFEEEGLEVEISRGFGSGDTASRVATGESDFGVVDISALLPMRVNEDLPVVAVAAHYAEPPHGIFYRPGDGIHVPGDLEGRSIATSPGNAVELLFPAFADATGFDAGAVEWLTSAPDAIRPAFLSGQADAVLEFAPNEPALANEADEEIQFFSFAEHGVSVHSHMLVASESTIAERPEVVARFVRAALRGNEFAVNNPQAAVENLMRHTPDNDPDLIAGGWEVAREFMMNDDTEEHGYGYISEERMRETFEWLVNATGLDPGDHTAEDLYTSEFLP